MERLFCPFCGGVVNIQLTDSEGKFRGGSYLKYPYRGIGYVLTHYEKDGVDCPIACEKGTPLGRRIYDTEEEAWASWGTIAKAKKRQEDEGWPYSFPHTCKGCKYYARSGATCNVHPDLYTYSDTPICDDFIPAPATTRQIMLIESMNEFCDEFFDLSRTRTKSEASQYIDRNIDEFKLKSMDDWQLQYK